MVPGSNEVIPALLRVLRHEGERNNPAQGIVADAEPRPSLPALCRMCRMFDQAFEPGAMTPQQRSRDRRSNAVSKIETATSDIDQDVHHDIQALRDDELGTVTGGRKSTGGAESWLVALAKAMGNALD
jgi:hypothetical protein